MKKRILAFFLAVLLLVGASPAAFGAFEDFTDVSGHWAEDFLKVAVADGIVQGYEDKTIRPDAPIKVSEMVVAINRILLPQARADLSAATDITEETWYYDDAEKAVALGLLDFSGGELGIDRPASREEIFIMMAEAFGYLEAQPDLTCLDAYRDLAGMTEPGRRAAAALINAGLVTGFGTDLYPKANIKRAEFLTLLYRMAYYHVDPNGVQNGMDKSASCPANSSIQSVSLYGQSLEQDLTITCPASYVNLTNVKSSARVLVRSEKLFSLNLGGWTELETLVLAQGEGNVSVAPFGGAKVERLVLADGGGSVSVSGNVANVEISGPGRVLTLGGGQVKSLVIGGSNAKVTVNAGVNLDSIRIAPQAENVELVLNGNAAQVTVEGKNAVISGSGQVTELVTESTAKGFDITVKSENFIDRVDHGLEGIEISFKVPEKVEAGGKLTVEGQITGVNVEKVCKMEWFEYGAGIGATNHTLKDGEYVYRSPEIKWKRDMPGEITVGLKLTYMDEELYREVTVPVENYDEAYWDAYEAEIRARQEAAIKAVSSEYRGNYRTQYAIDNDYSEQIKTDFVNGKGYASDTRYLLWVNRAFQHVNVFVGSQGEWELHKQFLCATGGRYTPTPVGVYKTTYKQVGWFTEEYTVKPVVRFLLGSGYAFHSRLYYPGTNRLSDASIGFPVSQGCIRMYDEDIQWIYDNIPKNTTVVVF